MVTAIRSHTYERSPVQLPPQIASIPTTAPSTFVVNGMHHADTNVQQLFAMVQQKDYNDALL